MLFNSIQYAIFLPVVFAVYWLLPHKFRWPLLLAASYYFYMSWNPKYVVLILFTTVVSYAAALLIERCQTKRRKRAVLTLALIVCLGVLFVFKYFNFFFAALESAFRLLAIPVHPITLQLILPVGISFYTFQTLSYVVDVYRGGAAERNFGVYATFVSFFPQLVAGPIERSENLLPQIRARHIFDYDQAMLGAKLIVVGLFKKLLIADAAAGYVDRVFANVYSYTGFPLVLAAFFFALQIYGDFSGYSDIAIGTAKLFGIDLMTNFRSPYFSASVKEFWSRWHISLSTWFKDYVYIPLGGNRCAKPRKYFNLLVTFLASGLWHGANWTYIAWGAIHGAAQIAEDLLKGVLKPLRENKIGHWVAVFLVFVFCNVTWIFFRAASIQDALYSILRRCKQKNWKPILISTPLLPEYWKEAQNQGSEHLKVFYSIVNQAATEMNIPYYDYSTDERFANRYDLFMNTDHLNRYGADEFEKILCKEVLPDFLREEPFDISQQQGLQPYN